MFLRLAKDGVVMVLHCSPVDDLLSGDAPCLIIKGGGRRIFYEQQSVALEAVRGCAEGTHSSGCFGDEKHGSAEMKRRD